MRQLCACGAGVWVALRLDSTLRMYHADTGEHLQDLDVAPFVTRVLSGGNERQSLVRIGAIAIAYSRLWIGTSSGIVLSVPFHQSTSTSKYTNDNTR